MDVVINWTQALLSSVGIKPLPPPPPPSFKTRAPAISASQSFYNHLPNQSRAFLRIGGISGALAICLGVYGAHVMRQTENEDLKRLFNLAQNYHLLHSVALLTLPLTKRPLLTGGLWIGGMALFLTPMYYHAICNDTRLRRITPYGGILLICGWLSLLF